MSLSDRWVGTYVRELRTGRGLSQYEVAEAAGVDRNDVNHLESRGLHESVRKFLRYTTLALVDSSALKRTVHLLAASEPKLADAAELLRHTREETDRSQSVLADLSRGHDPELATSTIKKYETARFPQTLLKFLRIAKQLDASLPLVREMALLLPRGMKVTPVSLDDIRDQMIVASRSGRLSLAIEFCLGLMEPAEGLERLRRDEARSLLSLGIVCHTAGLHFASRHFSRKAVRAIELDIESTRGADEVQSSLRLRTLIQLAAALRELGELDDAQAAIDQLPPFDEMKHNDKTMFLHHLAWLRVAQKRPEEAIEFLERTYAMDPPESDGFVAGSYIQHARALLVADRSEECFRMLAKVEHLLPRIEAVLVSDYARRCVRIARDSGQWIYAHKLLQVARESLESHDSTRSEFKVSLEEALYRVHRGDFGNARTLARHLRALSHEVYLDDELLADYRGLLAKCAFAA